MKFFCCATTKSATIKYVVEICSSTLNGCFKYEDKTKFDNLCKRGCPNYSYKWSCPPYAPLFEDFVSRWEKIHIIFMHTDMFQFAYIQNDYLKIKAANNILKSRADRFIREMANQHGKSISTGSCRLCKPCKCKLNMPCAHPELMTYSFEALGIDVGSMIGDYFEKPLIWYKRNYLPEYTSVVCGILTNESLSEEYLQVMYKKYITY